MPYNTAHIFSAKPTATVPPQDDSDMLCRDANQPQVEFGIIMILLVVVGLIGNLIVFSIILILQEYKKSVTNW